ncbi:MAG: hypothetical protein JNN30_05300, partial [Rhodanobacteraceae bacterium]|nr:hypothetical protein [Rhodanobacteraceae bacterium]
DEQRFLHAHFRAINALTPYVDEAVLEHAARGLPPRLLEFMPHLAAAHAAARLREATLPALALPRRRHSF